MGGVVSWQRQSRARVGSALCAWALIALLAAPISRAQSPPKLAAAIPPQTLAGALATFANQTHLQLLYVSELARSKTSKGAPAGLVIDDALARLLDGTGLLVRVPERAQCAHLRGAYRVLAAGIATG